MTENNDKEPSPEVKPATGRFRNTRLHWLRPQAAGAVGSEAIESGVEQQPPEAPAALQRRLTILTRLAFIPSSLEAYGRRVRWRRRIPMVLGLLAAAVAIVWVFYSLGGMLITPPDHVAAPRLIQPLPQPPSTPVTVARPAELEPALRAAPPAPSSSAARHADAAASKPAPAATEKKPRTLRQPPQAEDPWL